MKRLYRISAAFLLTVAMAFIILPNLPGNKVSAVNFAEANEGTEFSLTTSDPLYYKFIPDRGASKSDRFVVIMKCVSAGGTPKVVQVDENGNVIGTEAELWGGREFDPVITKSSDNFSDPAPVYFRIKGGLGSRFVIRTYAYWYNQDMDNAEEIYDYDYATTGVSDWAHIRMLESKESYGTLYYYISASEKAYYRISPDSGTKLYIKNGSGNFEYVNSENTFLVDKGSRLYIEIVCNKDRNELVEIYRKAFNRMTSMKFNVSSCKLAEGASRSITVKSTPLDAGRSLESTVKSCGIYKVRSDGSLQSAGGVDIKKLSDGEFTITGKNPGKYMIRAINSEGMKCSAVVQVTPKIFISSGVSSEGNCTSSTIKWYPQQGANKYAIYVKNSAGTFVKKGMTSKASFKLKGLKANKIYSVKIAAVASGTYNGKQYNVYGPQSNAFKVVTAPSKKPVIRSAVSTGTKYYKAKKTWHSGRWDAGGVWHPGYYTTRAAYSSAAVRISYSRIKGASSYQSNGMNFSISSKGIAGYTFSGRIKAGKTTTVKVRTVKKLGRSVAYGPWSRGRTVRLKAAQ